MPKESNRLKGNFLSGQWGVPLCAFCINNLSTVQWQRSCWLHPYQDFFKTKEVIWMPFLKGSEEGLWACDSFSSCGVLRQWIQAKPGQVRVAHLALPCLVSQETFIIKCYSSAKYTIQYLWFLSSAALLSDCPLSIFSLLSLFPMAFSSCPSTALCRHIPHFRVPDRATRKISCLLSWLLTPSLYTGL